MTVQNLKDKWPLYAAMILANLLLLFCTSCPPTVPSLLNPNLAITRAELQIELDRIIAIAETRIAALDKKQALRDLILKNALLMVETGTLNPVGIATALFGAYGIGHGASKLNKSLKRHKKGEQPNGKATQAQS